MGQALAALLQRAVSKRAVGIDEGEFAAASLRHMGVDEIGDGVVGAALGEIVQHALPLCP